MLTLRSAREGLTASCEVKKTMKGRKETGNTEGEKEGIYTWDEGGSLAQYRSDSLPVLLITISVKTYT